MPESRVDAIVEELRVYQRWLASEVRRVERALHALSDDDDEETLSTNEMLLEAFKRSGKPMSIQDAYLRLRKAGWTTESKDPTNVIRAALARMAANGELRRLSDKRGVYALASDDPFEDLNPPESADELNADTNDPWPPKVDQDDPWGSSPRVTKFGSDTISSPRFTRPSQPMKEDEPPF